MTTRIWAPGEFINPGDLRQPRSAAPVVTNELLNPGFETGDLTSWVVGDPLITVVAGPAFEGTYSLRHPDGLLGVFEVSNTNVVPVTPGQQIKLGCRYRRETNVSGRQTMKIVLRWQDASHATISETEFEQAGGAVNVWYDPSVTGTAPAGAAFVRAVLYTFQTGTGGSHHQYFDNFSWDYVAPVAAAGLVYKAVQANAGFTAATEPVWPTVLGNTVVDNEVTWEAVLASNVTWEATPILLSGAIEPTFPVEVGATVLDNTVVWKAISRRITDENCPNSKVVAIAASKIFAGDLDIIKFSATVNPLDWTTRDDAGYLPFGLQTLGSNPVAVLGLYRSNLVAFNSQGFQMWQVDQDPANMAYLDSVPVGSTFPHTWVPVANDLVGLTAVGVRNISIAGASTNLQADGVGEPIDPLVKAEIKLLAGDDEVFSFFWPAAGQHWTIFGTQAFVLTINAAKKKSWSRYVFPNTITDWTLEGNTLVVRAGTKVWEFDDEALQDDMSEGDCTMTAGAGAIGDTGFFGFLNVPSLTSVTGSVSDTGFFGSTIRALYSEFFFSAYHNFYLILEGDGEVPADDAFVTLTVDTDTGERSFLASAATKSTVGLPANMKRWTWFSAAVEFSEAETYAFACGDHGVDFEGVVWWPYLDMGAIGVEKGMVGLDLVCTAPEGVFVSVGYNQNNRTQRTPDYEVDADTLTGDIVPFPVSGPSFDLRLTFSANQAWEWNAANLYINDWRMG